MMSLLHSITSVIFSFIVSEVCVYIVAGCVVSAMTAVFIQTVRGRG